MLCPSTPLPAQAQNQDQAQLAYDIPEQNLSDALDAFASQSNVSIAFDADVVGRHRSTRLSGNHTPQIALQTLLARSGLRARFTGPHSVIIFDPRLPVAPVERSVGPSRVTNRPTITLDLAVVEASRMIGRRNPGQIDQYVQQAAREIQAIFARHPDYREAVFRTRIAVSIAPDGTVSSLTLLRSTGDLERDGRVPSLVVGRTIGAPPPEGLAQPLTFEITGKPLSSREGAR
ncbi:hypothetical protein [Croceibacterium xixiisoli]|nr:hypothetical protein [Croceibacterium xixiisoli]